MMSPRDRSFTDFDRPYRKGVVLGLSLAEIFIILVFLLLLALIGLGEFWREAEEKIGTIETLKNNLEHINSELEKEKESQNKEINELKDRLSEAQDKNKIYDNEIGDEDPIKLIEQKDDIIKVLEGNIEKAKDNLKSIKDKHAEQMDKIKEKLEQTNNILKKTEKQLTSITQEPVHGKGQDSPCWYRLEKEGERFKETPLYIFHIRIFDNHLFVKDIPAPNEFYEIQKKTLNFDRTKLNKNISFNKFLRAFRPLKQAGHANKVRDRRCTFYVGIWNKTTNDKSYLYVKEDIVDSVFGTYRFRTDPWPH